MADMTALQVITASYRKVGKINPTTQEKADGLEDLQNMLSSWSAEGLMVPNNVTETLTLTTGQAIYTIGEDGTPDFDTVRPVRLISAFFRISNIDYPIDVNMSNEEYSRVSAKNLELIPSRIYYDPQYPNAKLKFDYEAQSALSMHLTSEKILTNPTATTTTFSIPLEYNEAMVYNLAIRLTPDNNTKIHPAVVVIADRSMQTIENLNANERLDDPVRLDSALVFGRNSRAGSMDINRGY